MWSWIDYRGEESIVTTAKVDFSSVRWGSVEWTNLVTLYLRCVREPFAAPDFGG
jgi:hypothetical protein